MFIIGIEEEIQAILNTSNKHIFPDSVHIYIQQTYKKYYYE